MRDRARGDVTGIALIGWVALVADAALVVIGAGLTHLVPRIPPDLQANAIDVFSVSIATFGLLGALVMTRQPANRFGWLLCAIAFVHALEYFTAGLAGWSLYQEGGSLPWGPYAAWLFVWLGGLHYVPSTTLLLLLFPDGKPPSRRWRPVLWLIGLGLVGFIVGVAALPGPLVVFTDVTNPLGVDGPLPIALAGSAGVVMLFAALASAASLGVRLRRARGMERQQLKWFLYGGVIVAGSALLMLLLGIPLVSATVLVSGALVILGACAGVAILRYRLYDIDLLFNRTAVYGATSATLGATFFVGIVALQPLFSRFTAGSEIATAASTLLSFALFQPVRGRLQKAVDLRFDRSRYDAARILDAFGDRLRDEVDLEALGADLVDAVSRTMGPAHVSLWLGRIDREAEQSVSAPSTEATALM